MYLFKYIFNEIYILGKKTLINKSNIRISAAWDKIPTSSQISDFI